MGLVINFKNGHKCFFGHRNGSDALHFLFAFFLLLLVEVIRRYVFNSPSVWGGELAQLLFGAYAILSGGVVLRENGHVNVDIIYANFTNLAPP